MKVLLDHNIPLIVGDLLQGIEVVCAKDLGWDRLKNGDILRAAERSNFTIMVTADQSIFYQQNNLLRRIALVVLSTNYCPAIESNIDLIHAAISRALPGGYELVPIPPGH